ncbi:MAG: acetate/propionate family kinase [Bacteroidales bacterium]|jgi:acetate kinase|nr:acetate/propionate family kinase [Bacteroidales bacterium]NMD03913.1 acetate kinase [Bacteroidales bacterium]OQB65566.1 MAG: Acetate kinase [Bacteroidetes bacterium ADurb.Bin145]HQK68358.1 acetate kinase [Bacteroidales bacterium]
MIILVLNCGSSSIKYQVFDMSDGYEMLAKGLLERIGLNESIITHKPTGKEQYKVITDIPDHTTGINMVMDVLCHPVHGVIKSVNEIKAVGHRVVNGGENYKESVLIDNDVKKVIEECIELAPLHNPANLKGILSVEKLIPGVPQVAVFDTSFHQTMPDYAYMYAIPYEYYEKYKIRKYGYHGTSHKYVANKAAKLAGKDIKNIKVITCHLGNGASITAVNKGESIDTSMGFTPVDGLIMGTRTGEVDPGVLVYIADKEHLNVTGVNNMINKKSGVFGISQISSDMRDLETAADAGNKKAILALKMYAYKVKKFIGSYMAALNGCDLLVFTGGIGENDFRMRKNICSDMENLGILFDDSKNDGARGHDIIISRPESRVTVMAVNTDEEFVIASDTRYIVEHHTV